MAWRGMTQGQEWVRVGMGVQGQRFQRSARALLVVALGCAVLAGCSRSSGMINIARDQTGPDEFAILPNKPIEIPATLSAELPPPTPGRPNRVDRNPQAEAVAALGGNPDRVVASGAPRSDGTLLAHAGRFGTDPSIREELAVADAEFRRRNRGRLLERLFRVTTYYDAYEAQELDQHGELDRVRAAGRRTPGAPPLSAE